MNNIRFTNFVFNVGGNGQAVEILPYNPKRKYLMIQNKGLINVFVGFDNKASELNGLRIGPIPNGYYEQNNAVTSSSISIFSVLRTQIVVIEGI